jgi:hypothetical protein
MLRRLLNIASIFCLVACVALMGMWVRSYWWFDQFAGPYSTVSYFGVTLVQGQVTVAVTDDTLLGATLGRNWKWRGFPLKDWDKAIASPVAYFPAGKPGPFFSMTMRLPRVTSNGFTSIRITEFVIPYWLPISISISLAALPWLPFRFSLRSLFIATTALAILMGMIVWLDQAWIGK